MLIKIKQIIEKENIQVEENIINTLIKITNGDMRKTIVLLQNLKYTIQMKTLLTKI